MIFYQAIAQNTQIDGSQEARNFWNSVNSQIILSLFALLHNLPQGSSEVHAFGKHYTDVASDVPPFSGVFVGVGGGAVYKPLS